MRAERIAAANPAQVPPRAKKLCLLVDDSRVIRKVARRSVESLGYEVIEAENGQEALAKCKVTMPDLILLDWNMPVMGGIEFITALRGVGGEHWPKVVFCTTNSNTLDIHKGIDAGAHEYVIKPFDHQTLLATLQRIGAA